jgi:hypothetical protein
MTQPPPQAIPQQQGPVALNPAQMAKLRSEFDIVQQNCKVFSEMLTEMTSGAEHPADEELLKVQHSCMEKS